MTKISTAIAAALITLSASHAAHAQFSLPSVAKSLTGNSAPAADLGGQQDVLVRGYVAANKDVLTANAQMAEALGLKEAAAASKATADALTDGATKDNLDAANKAVSASTDAVAAEMAKHPKLDAKSKTMYSQGLLSLAGGVGKYVGLGKNVSTMSSGLSSASPMQLPKLQSAVYVVSKFPDSMSSVSSALKNATAFAKSQDIPVPAGVNDALAAL